MVNSHTSVQMSAAYATTTMELGNAKKGVKNLLVEKNGPTRPKKARLVDGKKEPSRATQYRHKKNIEDQVRKHAISPPYPAVDIWEGRRMEGRWEAVTQLTHIRQVFNPLEAKKGKKAPFFDGAIVESEGEGKEKKLVVVPVELFRVNIPCNAKHGVQLKAKYLAATRMTGACFKDRVLNSHGWVNVKWSNGEIDWVRGDRVQDIADVAFKDRRRHKPDRLVPGEDISEREVPLRQSNNGVRETVESYYDMLVERPDRNARNHDWNTKEMKAKLLTEMHGYQQTIRQKAANPGNREQANELEEKKLKAERSMKKVKEQLKKLEESAREDSDEVAGIKDDKVRTPAQMMELGDTKWRQNQMEKQAMCHIKNEQPPPKHWSIRASLVYEAIRGTVVGVSIPELDKAFGI